VVNAPSLLRLVLLLAPGHQPHLVAIELPCGMEASVLSQYGRRHFAAQLACCPRFCLLGCTGISSLYTGNELRSLGVEEWQLPFASVFWVARHIMAKLIATSLSHYHQLPVVEGIGASPPAMEHIGVLHVNLDLVVVFDRPKLVTDAPCSSTLPQVVNIVVVHLDDIHGVTPWIRCADSVYLLKKQQTPSFVILKKLREAKPVIAVGAHVLLEFRRYRAFGVG